MVIEHLCQGDATRLALTYPWGIIEFSGRLSKAIEAYRSRLKRNHPNYNTED